jgi:hypothetical protein
MVPVYLFDEYNDVASLKEFYPGMKRYIDYLTTKADNATGIIAYGLSDWTCTSCVDMGVTATMVFIEGLQNMARMATALGKPDDATAFKAQATKSTAGYTAAWYDTTSGGFDSKKGSGAAQCATAMPLALGVAPNAPLSTNYLVNSISNAHNHSETGEIGWPYMVRSLVSTKQDDTLMAMLHRTDSPSYLYQYSMGATTLTEEWNAAKSDSWNHAMDGHIDAWFFERVGGLRSTSVREAGALIELEPRPLEGVTWAEVTRAVLGGVVSMRWEHDTVAQNFDIKITVPPSSGGDGTGVHVYLPTAAMERVTWTTGIEHVRFVSSDSQLVVELSPGAHSLTVAV